MARILVADPDDQQRAQVVDALRGAGHDVAEAVNVFGMVSALTAGGEVSAMTFDLVLSEMVFDDELALDVLRDISPRAPGLKFAVLTHCAPEDSVAIDAMVRAFGGLGVVPKSLAETDLLAMTNGLVHIGGPH